MNHPIRVMDLFSGVGGFALGLKRAGGFETACYCEIDTHCHEVLKARMNDGKLDSAPLWNDVTDLDAEAFCGQVDLVTAGWPCQGNSIAGKRGGMQDARSSLWGQVCRILRDTKAEWFLGENVPGLFSVNGGLDFLQVLRDLDDLGYGVCWRVLDAQYFGVPQRRRRVFVVGRLGAPCPPEVLFEPEGGAGDSPKGGEARKTVAYALRANPSHSGDKGDGGINTTMVVGSLTASNGGPDDNKCQAGQLVAAPQTARCVTASCYKRHDDDNDTLVASKCLTPWDAETKRIHGANGKAPTIAGCDGKGGQRMPYVAGTLSSSGSGTARPGGQGAEDSFYVTADSGLTAIGFNHRASNPSEVSDKSPTLRVGSPGGGVLYRTTHALTTQCGSATEDGTGRLRADAPGHQPCGSLVRNDMSVRRLTPVECERLMGFPDNWTFGADSRRYKAMGNSVAVPVIEWIGRRILSSLSPAAQSVRGER